MKTIMVHYGEAARTYAPRALNLYRVMTGDVRPELSSGWHPKRPFGTFDNVLLFESKKFVKGDGLDIPVPIWRLVEQINPGDSEYTQEEKLNWLQSKNGTDMVLMWNDDTDLWRQHVPEVAGGAVVNVLEKGTVFSKIECLDVTKPLPNSIPEHLIYTWRALTKDGRSYVPRGGVRFLILYWRSWAYVPTEWLVKV